MPPEPYPKPVRREKRRLGHNSTLAAPKEPMRAFSEKRRRLYDERYLPARAVYLEAHPECEVRIPNRCTRKAVVIHHMVQRSLDPSVENLLDETHWMASCNECNEWISDNSAEARLLGVELSPKEREG